MRRPKVQESWTINFQIKEFGDYDDDYTRKKIYDSLILRFSLQLLKVTARLC